MDADAARSRRRGIAEAKMRLRELRLELGALNHLVGTRVKLKDSDLDTLDVISRHGPLSPTALARCTGIHLATLTGILNRLEAGAWIVRERDDSDRRAIVIRAVPERQREVFRLYGGMNASLDEILDGYTADELTVIVDFLRRTTDAGRVATEDL
jgi:DNA-binding MarR family transcriptional regulator